MTSKPAVGGPSSTRCHSLGENAALVVMALSYAHADGSGSRKSIPQLAAAHLTRNGSYANTAVSRPGFLEVLVPDNQWPMAGLPRLPPTPYLHRRATKITRIAPARPWR